MDEAQPEATTIQAAVLGASGPPVATIARSFALLLRDPGTLNRAAVASGSLASPLTLYGVGSALGLGAAEILGEANTGALFVFGGGVFSKVAGIGEWLAFQAIVPVLAGCLFLLFRRSRPSWREHLVFALHIGAIIGLGTAAESLLVAVLGTELLAGLAAWVMLLLVIVYYALALMDTYGRSTAALARGTWAVCGVLATWMLLATVLFAFTDFTL